MIDVSVSVAIIIVQSSTAADQGYHAFGELARFVYCLQQKNKKASSLPLVDKWEEYVVPNHSRFPAINEKDFLSGTRVMAELHIFRSRYLRTEFCRNALRFLEKFVNCVLSTVASRSVIRHGMSCFCPAIAVGGDNVAPFQLFNKLWDGLLEKGWTRGSEVEACRAECQFFVQEQRQLERLSTRSCPDVGDVLTFCSAQVGLRAHQHLYKVCIVSSQTCCSNSPELSRHPHKLLLFQVFQLTILVTLGLATHGEKFIVSFESCCHQRRRSACCPALCAGFCSEPAL